MVWTIPHSLRKRCGEDTRVMVIILIQDGEPVVGRTHKAAYSWESLASFSLLRVTIITCSRHSYYLYIPFLMPGRHVSVLIVLLLI